MRWMMVIVILAAVATALVHFRRSEVRARHEIRQLDRQQVQLRRQLWDQQILLGEVTSPGRIRQIVQVGSLDLADRSGTVVQLSDSSGGAGSAVR
ncbi:hypothetical protein LCGC14_0513030 [marine sediment metagenome]|uniref:Cell division protein FtsL n=1 Tax=marine sediment metagenome TaxID=412755 RepID=A0A0F9S0S2_9ZZZZ|nr:hypothetical protein [Phycisphaerae bacterium]HDZ43814.1 hypothetical protein [Phycisphaerae bacterium]